MDTRTTAEKYTQRCTLSARFHNNPWSACWSTWSNLEMVAGYHNFHQDYAAEAKARAAMAELEDMAHALAHRYAFATILNKPADPWPSGITAWGAADAEV